MKCEISVHEKCKDLIDLKCCKQLSSDKTTTTTTDIACKNTYDHISRVSIKDFDIIQLLEVGSFSKVYLARLSRNKNTISDKLFAIKVIRKTNTVISSDPESVFTEKQVLNFGRIFPFLTIAHCCFQSMDRLYFVMEYIPGKNLLHHLTRAKRFNEQRTRIYAAEIVLALEYLHSNKIIYRDLKLENIILDKDGRCKLLDFGMSKNLLNQESTRTFCGTPEYIAPEIILEHDYGYSVDWWSLGILLYEMMIGYPPFTVDGDTEKLYEIILEKRVEFPSGILSDQARLIIEDLLTKDHTRRLGCVLIEGGTEAIKVHPFFPSYQSWWHDIRDMRITPPFVPSESDSPLSSPDDMKLQRQSIIADDELKGITQSDFDGFSFYSKTFTDLANLKPPDEESILNI